MGAGILPIAFNGVCMVFLLGKEQNNEWSDFGGTSLNVGELTFNTALREGHEELSGMLGPPDELKKQIINNYVGPYIDCSNYQTYTSFVFETEYDESLIKYFNRNYDFVKRTSPNIINDSDNGLYEKKEIDWFTKEEIYKLKLRPFYKNIIYSLIDDLQDNKLIN
jgi:hypothetical protein